MPSQPDDVVRTMRVRSIERLGNGYEEVTFEEPRRVSFAGIKNPGIELVQLTAVEGTWTTGMVVHAIVTTPERLQGA